MRVEAGTLADDHDLGPRLVGGDRGPQPGAAGADHEDVRRVGADGHTTSHGCNLTDRRRAVEGAHPDGSGGASTHAVQARWRAPFGSSYSRPSARLMVEESTWDSHRPMIREAGHRRTVGTRHRGVSDAIVVNEFMSLDGVVQAPGGAEEDTDGGFAHGGWSGPYFDPEVMGAAIGEGMNTADALLFGRRTWQAMAAAWPGRAGDPFADQMNAVKKYVASRTLTPDDLTWNNTTLLSPDHAVADVAALREQDGRDVVIMGQRQPGDGPPRRGPGRRAQPHDRADPARRRQADLPRGRHGSAARARQ